MGIVYTFLASAVIFVVLWSLGAKALDLSLLVLLIMVIAASAHIIWPYLPGNRKD